MVLREVRTSFSKEADLQSTINGMAVDVVAIGEQLQQLSPRKYYVDRRRLAVLVNVSQGSLVDFFTAIKRGGQGLHCDGTWESNPAPYDGKIDVGMQSEDNILNLYKQANGRKSGSADTPVHSDPSPSVLQERCDYCLLGRARLRSNIITPTVQREMAGVIIGTDSNLNGLFPTLCEERRRIWEDWANGGENSALYDTSHLPWILLKYRTVWDFSLPKGDDVSKITATMKRAGKREIINLLDRQKGLLGEIKVWIRRNVGHHGR